MINESNDEGIAISRSSVLDIETISVVESENLDKNGNSIDGFNLEEERRWVDSPDSKVRLN